MTDWSAFDRQIEENIRKQTEAIKAGTYKLPPPKPSPVEDDDDGPAYLTPAWHLQQQRKREAEEAAAAATKAQQQQPTPLARPGGPLDTYTALVYKNNPEMPRTRTRKVRKPGQSKIGQRVAEMQFSGRACEVCHYPTNGISSLCETHKRRRNHFGSVLVKRGLELKDYRPHFVIAFRYLKANPAPQPVLDAMSRFLEVPARLRKTEQWYRERNILVTELERWASPRWRYKTRQHRETALPRHYDYTPKGYLAVLLGVELYMRERDWRGLPGDAPDYESVRALRRYHKYPGSRTSGKHAIILRELVKRFRASSSLSVYISTTAAAILTEMKKWRPRRDHPNRKDQRAKNRQTSIRPPAPTRPPAPPRVNKERRITLPARYPKPTTRPDWTVEQLREWERVESLHRQWPAGFYIERYTEEQ